MELRIVDPRSLRENPDNSRRTAASPEADAMLQASVAAVGIIQPPGVRPDEDGALVIVFDQTQLTGVFLDGRVADEPRRRHHHREEHVQLGVLLDRGLAEEHGARRVEAGGEPVDEHLEAVGDQLFRFFVAVGQRVPVGNEEEAIVLRLELQPVAQGAPQMAEMKTPRRSKSTDDPHLVLCPLSHSPSRVRPSTSSAVYSKARTKR